MQPTALSSQKSSLVSNSTLLLLAFASAFFPRLLDTLGAPSAINFLHFATVPLVFAWILLQRPINDRQHLYNCKALLTGIFIFLIITIASALLNNAGAINVLLSFLILTEPFMFLLALVWAPISSKHLERLQTWVFRFSVFHIFLAFAQKVLVDSGLLTNDRLGIPQDNIQGVFYLSGSGHVVGSSVSVAFVLYYLLNFKRSPIWLRCSITLAAIVQNVFAETKQVILVCLVSFAVLTLLRARNIKVILQYFISFILVISVFWWLTQNVEAFRGYNTWADPALYGSNGEATDLKLSSIHIILSHYFSPLNWLLGLGPGHTVGRLGGWMLEKYADLLTPFGATVHSVSKETWAMVWGTRLGPRSSMFSPLWGWAGVWGDLGFLGLGTYLYLFYLLLFRLCKDDFSKFLVIQIFVNGLIFSQMEEPGYTLYTIFLIALIWHQKRLARKPQHKSLRLTTR